MTPFDPEEAQRPLVQLVQFGHEARLCLLLHGLGEGGLDFGDAPEAAVQEVVPAGGVRQGGIHLPFWPEGAHDRLRVQPADGPLRPALAHGAAVKLPVGDRPVQVLHGVAPEDHLEVAQPVPQPDVRVGGRLGVLREQAAPRQRDRLHEVLPARNASRPASCCSSFRFGSAIGSLTRA
jgi:hypothetical protein